MLLDAEGEPAGVFRIPHAALSGQLLITGAAGSGKSQTVAQLLRQLTAAGIPWLVVEPDASEYARLAAGTGPAGGPGQITVLNPADPHAAPLTLNPLEPEPGYPVQAHIEMVRALLTAALYPLDPPRPRDPLPHVLAQALRRVYEATGWDTVTGGAVPGAIVAPGIPSLCQLQRAAVEAAADLGLGGRSQADVRVFVQVRLGSLWDSPAGRFLEGGHPADLGELLRRNVVITFKDVAAEQDKTFLMGALLIRLAEHLRMRERQPETRGLQGVGGLTPGGLVPGALRHVIVIEEAHWLATNPGAAQANSSAPGSELFAALLGEVRSYGEGVVLAGRNPVRFFPEVLARAALKIEHRSAEPGVAAVTAAGASGATRVRVSPAAVSPAAMSPGASALTALSRGAESGRLQESPLLPAAHQRSPACGRQCRQVRACSLFELRSAELLTGGDQDAWLRIWTDTLVIAVLTCRPLPHVPAPLRRRWDGLDPRLRECLLANVIDRAVAARSATVDHTYAPRRLTAVIAATATRTLASGPASRATCGAATGPAWVVPQLRWLHELDRLGPFHHAAPDLDDIAPPLDFDLPGLPDWPGIRVRHRLRGLRRHPLSMEREPNRLLAARAILGDDDHAAFDADLATAMPGTETGELLRQAARTMERSASAGHANVGRGLAGRDLPWLEVVLSWPRLFSPEHHWQWPAEGADVRSASDR
jgi:hypothetical protein